MRITRLPPLIVFGDESQVGSYVLRLSVRDSLRLSFGRFKKGRTIAIPSGEYLYIGSALGSRGAVSLGRRLVRHATRTGDKPPHAIRASVLEQFRTLGLGDGDLLPVNGKHLFWNIDHLLDEEAVEIVGLFIIRNDKLTEQELGQFFQANPRVSIPEPGLGANDIPGNTHILRVEAEEDWWEALPEKIALLIDTVDPIVNPPVPLLRPDEGGGGPAQNTILEAAV